MTLTNDAQLLVEVVNDLDRDGLDADIDRNLICLAMIREARTQLGHVERELENKIAPFMDKRVVVNGVGTFEVHRRKKRSQWDSDDLLRAVLDTKLVDSETGEVLEETPLDRVLHVWNLGAPRVTALRARGLDEDEFCHTEDAGLAIQLITN